MIDVLTTAEPKSREPIFALDIDPDDPQIPPVDNPKEVERFAEAAERLKDGDFARQVYESFGAEPIRSSWDEYAYKKRTSIRFNEIGVDGTIVPVAVKVTTPGDHETEKGFADRWREGDPSSFYNHSLLQRGIYAEGIWMVDYNRLGYQGLYHMFSAMNMFTPKGRKYALEAMKFGASWLAITEPYGRVQDSFPKGFVVPGGTSPQMHLYRTYDYGMLMDDPRKHFNVMWFDRGNGDITKNNGLYCWFPLVRPFDRSTTFVDDATIQASGIKERLRSVLSHSYSSHTDIMSAAKEALQWYKDHPKFDYSTSAIRKTAFDAAAAIVDHLDNDHLFRDYEAEVFRINETDSQMVFRSEPGPLLLSNYTEGRDERCGPIAGRLRCSMKDARKLVEHIPKDLAKGICDNYFPKPE